MTATIGANGELFPYPEAGETGWGPDGTNWAIAVSQALTKLGLGGSTTPKAILNIVSTTAGILVPRMTSLQRDAMFPVPDSSYRGLMIFNLDVDFYQIYDGTAWISPTSIMSMTANTVPVADGTGNALVNSPMTVSGTKVTQTGAMDITGVAGLLGGANLNSQKITSLLAGTAGTDAVNKTQMDAGDIPGNFTKIVTGGSRAPTGTQVKMSWFEGTLDGSGSISLAHSLTTNILAVLPFLGPLGGSNEFVMYRQTSTYSQTLYFTDSVLGYDTNNGTYFGSGIKFLVLHK